MRAPPLTALAILAGAIGCAGSREVPPEGRAASAAPSPPAAASPARCRIERGMDAAAVTKCLGPPDAVEDRASAASPGTTYQRWVYRAPPGAGGALRVEVWMIDGRIADVTGTREQP